MDLGLIGDVKTTLHFPCAPSSARKRTTSICVTRSKIIRRRAKGLDDLAPSVSPAANRSIRNISPG